MRGPGSEGVWRAVDEATKREVAVKALSAYQVGDSVARARFRLVLRTVAELSCPQIAPVHEYGEVAVAGERIVPFFVRELVPGPTLEQRLTERPLSIDEALRALAPVAEALAVAHQAGVIHGNLVPANVMLGRAGVKVTDFGLWMLGDQEPGEPEPGDQEPGEPEPGEPGRRVPFCTAPELAAGGTATPAADMYALGAIMVACLGGGAALDTPGGAPALAELAAVGAGMGSVWAACLRARPAERPSAMHTAVMSQQMAAARPSPAASAPVGREITPAPSAAAGRAQRSEVARTGPARAAAPARNARARWRPLGTHRNPPHRPSRPNRARPGSPGIRRERGRLAVGGAAAGLALALAVGLAQFQPGTPVRNMSPTARITSPTVRSQSPAGQAPAPPWPVATQPPAPSARPHAFNVPTPPRVRPRPVIPPAHVPHGAGGNPVQTPAPAGRLPPRVGGERCQHHRQPER
jgi:eukaryotic-like serine/threonine-protein kinase